MKIVIDNLKFSYGRKRVLNNINLTIKSGETVGIVGVSGGGKSTLLKLISGLYEVQNGSIDIGGSQSSAGRRRNVAMVMQNAMLFPASIRDNISCGHAMEDAVLYHACELAQLSGWISGLPRIPTRSSGRYTTGSGAWVNGEVRYPAVRHSVLPLPGPLPKMRL